MSNNNFLLNPTRLKPFVKGSKEMLQVVIETPKGSQNKYAFDPEKRIFKLKAVLPAGMDFPYDFGFLPGTVAPDGDGLDVLVFMDAPAFPGCLIQARVIGVIEGEQLEEGKKKPVRNDRIVAVADANHKYKSIKKMSDVPPLLINELGDFFVNYHKLEGKKYKLLGNRGSEAAIALIKKYRS
jgi:inorganic pyrophosphatase